jgi:hypothetical protein
VGTLHRIGFDGMLASRPCVERKGALAMIAARILAPGSKHATARGLNNKGATNTLAEELGVEAASAGDLYAVMDWLLER